MGITIYELPVPEDDNTRCDHPDVEHPGFPCDHTPGPEPIDIRTQVMEVFLKREITDLSISTLPEIVDEIVHMLNEAWKDGAATAVADHWSEEDIADMD